MFHARDGAIFSKNSTFVFFDGASPITESGIQLRSPSPIMAPGTIASERLIHGLVTFSHIGNPWLSRLSRTRSTIDRPFIGDLCMYMNINIYFLNVIIFAFYAIVV